MLFLRISYYFIWNTLYPSVFYAEFLHILKREEGEQHLNYFNTNPYIVLHHWKGLLIRNITCWSTDVAQYKNEKNKSHELQIYDGNYKLVPDISLSMFGQYTFQFKLWKEKTVWKLVYDCHVLLSFKSHPTSYPTRRGAPATIILCL